MPEQLADQATRVIGTRTRPSRRSQSSREEGGDLAGIARRLSAASTMERPVAAAIVAKPCLVAPGQHAGDAGDERGDRREADADRHDEEAKNGAASRLARPMRIESLDRELLHGVGLDRHALAGAQLLALALELAAGREDVAAARRTDWRGDSRPGRPPRRRPRCAPSPSTHRRVPGHGLKGMRLIFAGMPLSSRTSAFASARLSLTSLSITYSKVMRRALDRPG